MRVLKFGGTSLAGADRIRQAASIVARYRQERGTVVVVSAMRGVTNRLLGLVDVLRAGNAAAALAQAKAVAQEHEAVLHRLALETAEEARLAAELDRLARTLAARMNGVSRRSWAEEADRIASFGERFMARLVAGALRQRRLRAQPIDAFDFLVTSGEFQNAEPRLGETCQRAERLLRPLLVADVIPVVTGFIGATPEGRITTLGRNSSDYSAAVTAYALEARELYLWTDVDGVFTADPQRVGEARWLPELSYQQALALAGNGARVVHPKTLGPLREKNIVLWVKNTLNPDAPGTRIANSPGEPAR